ncbi:hypothetical protein [Massilia sp. CF038]|nr:hypothetical protein [Massilia sp. CF038]
MRSRTYKYGFTTNGTNGKAAFTTVKLSLVDIKGGSHEIALDQI